jgi:hypothetical protein
MNFVNFFRGRLPTLLEEYVEYSNSFNVQPDRCRHHSAGKRACVCLVVPRNNLSIDAELLEKAKILHGTRIAPDSPDFEHPFFWRGWYFLTLMDQCIHAHFRGEYRNWEDATGRYPLPMFPAGFRCWHVASPNSLLQGTPVDDDWRGACAFFMDEAKVQLRSHARIEPSEFFNAIRRDPDFGGPHEKILAEFMP